jgi:hypothetical protein
MQKHRDHGPLLQEVAGICSIEGWVERSDTHQEAVALLLVIYQRLHRRRQTPHQEAEWNRCVRG